MHSLPLDLEKRKRAVDLLERILAALERIESAFDEYARVNLEARYPYGKPDDRWSRRR